MSNDQKVTLFIQCLVDTHYPEVAEAMVRVLQRLGVSPSCPVDQTCCGQPAFNSGYRRQARIAARHFIEVFDEAETIVCPSGSCVNMVRHHYQELFQNEPHWLPRALNIARRTFEFSEYLVDVLGIDDLGARFEGRVTYHDSCHLMRGIGVRQQPRTLLQHVAGIDFIEMRDSDYCCGFGGTFSVKYPDISDAMVTDKVKNIIATKADAVVGCDMGCLMNIQGKLSRIGSAIKVMHIAQILAA
ncbi:MAG: (Fe-S)-binding protein [Deltaproteobacteria bacterium]|jgi:L-lactate dehydrogenase complex protein LldE|nr:(Fe-S)-binding protein [Deltaproteobacteria bacterium]